MQQKFKKTKLMYIIDPVVNFYAEPMFRFDTLFILRKSCPTIFFVQIK